MEMDVKQLQEGLTLAENVYAKSGQPIIYKNTVLTDKHLEILDAFLIKSVSIHNQNEVEKEQEDSIIEDGTSFTQLYMKAFKDYKRLFTNWQAGASINILTLSRLLLPILKHGLEDPLKIFTLYKFNTRSDYIYHHSIAVALMAAYLGKRLNMGKGDYYQLGLAGLISNCGMAKIPPYLYQKSEKLTPEGYYEIKKHTIIGYQMLKRVTGIKEGVLLSVIQHHEREDGSGYPLSTKGSQLHPYSQIVSVADVYQAMTSDRLHSKGRTPFEVIEEMLQPFGKFNPKVLKVLLDEWDKLSIGLKVKLNNKDIGQIVFFDRNLPSKPLIKIEHSDEIISLKEHSALSIQEIIEE